MDIRSRGLPERLKGVTLVCEVKVGLHIGPVLELLGGEPEHGKGTEPLPGGGGEVHQGTANRAAVGGGVVNKLGGWEWLAAGALGVVVLAGLGWVVMGRRKK
jgi:hypothetical protein